MPQDFVNENSAVARIKIWLHIVGNDKIKSMIWI